MKIYDKFTVDRAVYTDFLRRGIPPGYEICSAENDHMNRKIVVTVTYVGFPEDDWEGEFWE